MTDLDWNTFIQHNMTVYRFMISDIHDSSCVLFITNLIAVKNLCWQTSAKTISGRLRRVKPGKTTKIAQQTKTVDIISEYLLCANGQLFEMNVKILRY